VKSVIFQKVLVLNASWLPVNFTTVKKAMEDMVSYKTPKMALKIEYAKNDDGSFNFDMPTEMIPLKWEQWASLLPREHDENQIRTPNLVLRLPTVIITPKYKGIPIKRYRPTKSVLFKMQDGRCGWTGEETAYKDLNLEHKTPKSRGGKNDFPNLMLVKKELNLKKGNKTPQEIGWKPLFNFKEPSPLPATISLIKEAIGHPDWNLFLFKNK
jgi:5-methylcytosine-specific restriction endonuclease McrA